MLGLEVEFMHRPPTPDDIAQIGVIDLEDGGEFEPVAQTRAWSWQQGGMLQWLPSAPDRLIIYNDCQDGRFVSVILDIHSGNSRTLPLPIYAVSWDGQAAMSLNFARLDDTRPGYGYAGFADPWASDPCPDDDGIYWMDLNTGEHKLIISLAQVAGDVGQTSATQRKHWFNHVSFSPDSRRLALFHRWQGRLAGDFRQSVAARLAHGRLGRWLKRMVGKWVSSAMPARYTRLITANTDGSDMRCIIDSGGIVSHYDWRSSDELLVWAYQQRRGTHYFLCNLRDNSSTVVGRGVLTQDGHCSYSPDGNWILTDKYPDKANNRTLILYRPQDNTYIELGKFFSPPELEGSIRCDLHPRWNRDGTQIGIDSAHEGHRQMYVVDIAREVALRTR